KILHEIRMGEMTNTGELPYARYYGSSDSTPLFIMLAGRYLQRTGDLAFVESVWPHIKRALDWINMYGDMDGDGFVEYARKTEIGIRNQAWKDSPESVFHENGDLAIPPIAICEIQGYVFAAKRQAAYIAQQLGLQKIAFELLSQAKEIQRNFEEIFWDDELPGYVLALDQNKKPCRVRSSNMGHCLFSGISSSTHAKIVADSLMDESFFSGWGVRTLAKGQPRYNPMSYHNGSIWPHDNAMIAEGMSRYGYKAYAGRILDAMFHVSQFTDLRRFPELFCGFDRRPNQGPTLYPVACSPQAWAAASIFSLLQSCLGLSIQASSRQVQFTQPYLPEFLRSIQVKNLAIGDAFIDFSAERNEMSVSITVLRRTDNISVIVST
ncbi:MAG TPA: amylo-alpha-1,6-glucosidase, partial [Deltaproteobacteria bacterium]|nr:amylo-alpha-1,6-glucosidase [Deltaproteobacteria bacterium]